MALRLVLEFVVTKVVNLKRHRRSFLYLIHDCHLAGRQFAVRHVQKSSKLSFKTRRAADRELDEKMATENNASAACRNFEQIYTLSTLCMPEL